MFDDLRSRAVLIAGAGSDLGQAVALGFGEAGARLAVSDPDQAAAEETARLVNVLGGEAVALAQGQGLLQSARDGLGRLDVIVDASGEGDLALLRQGLALLAESEDGGALLAVAAPGPDPRGAVRELAREAAASGVRVNGVLPLAEGELAPLGREIRPDDVVGPVLFLASRAGSFVTGAFLAVDGGRSLVPDPLT